MKIKMKALSYDRVLALPPEKRMRPVRPAPPLRWLMRSLSLPELRQVDFTCARVGMERLGKDECALFLMNHSSFIDLKIAAAELYPRPFQIVCTSDGFVGKAGVMRAMGCIPTRKFLTDTALVRDMLYALHDLHSSVLLYPEASYSFDGTATPLPDSLGRLLKLLKVPVVMIRTRGAFLRDPLYNGLQLRRVPVRAELRYVLSPEEIAAKSADELQEVLRGLFTFDNFREQQEDGIRVTEPFRADGLNRVLYKCPSCRAEGNTEGRGERLTCHSCGKTWQLTESGEMEAADGEDFFRHIPDWYAWERQCVREELENGTYRLDVPVLIRMLVDSKCLYTVGEGRLIHDVSGFHLTGCGGALDFRQPPSASYSLYADYFWYELGDMICIGDAKALYYCFPQDGSNVAAKTRLAAEELYRMTCHRRNPSSLSRV